MFVNDGSHFTLSGAKPKTIWVTLAMSGIDEDFDLFATPIHEYCRPSRASGITPVAPPRASVMGTAFGRRMFPPPVGKRGVRPFDEVWVFTKGGLVNVNMQSTVHTVICMVSPNPRRLVPRYGVVPPGRQYRGPRGTYLFGRNAVRKRMRIRPSPLMGVY